MFRLIACVMGIAICPGALPAPAVAHDIKGFVIDGSEQPVAGATISLEGTGVVAITDSLGNYVLPEVPDGAYNVSVRSGCLITGYVPDLQVPRPLQVPLPVVAHRMSCDEPVDAGILDAGTQAELVGRVFDQFLKDASRTLGRSLLQDGAIAFIALNGQLDEARFPDGLVVPVRRVDISQRGSEPVEATEPIPLQVCLATPDADTAIVLMLRATPPLPDELDIFLAGQTLQTFSRQADGVTWRPIHQLFCLSADDVQEDASPNGTH